MTPCPLSAAPVRRRQHPQWEHPHGGARAREEGLVSPEHIESDTPEELDSREIGFYDGDVDSRDPLSACLVNEVEDEFPPEPLLAIVWVHANVKVCWIPKSCSRLHCVAARPTTETSPGHLPHRAREHRAGENRAKNDRRQDAARHDSIPPGGGRTTEQIADYPLFRVADDPTGRRLELQVVPGENVRYQPSVAAEASREDALIGTSRCKALDGFTIGRQVPADECLVRVGWPELFPCDESTSFRRCAPLER